MCASPNRLQNQKTPLFTIPVSVTEVHAVTDQGTAVALFRYDTFTPEIVVDQLTTSNAEYYRQLLRISERQYLARTALDSRKVIRLGDVDPASNCHGWVFTGGKFGVWISGVHRILSENGYVPAAAPTDGDLAIYADGKVITHSGVVRHVKSGTVLVESKWEEFGVFLHQHDGHPFLGRCTFFRSSRVGHLVALREASGP